MTPPRPTEGKHSPLPWIYENLVKLSEKGIPLGSHYQLMSYEHDWNSKDPKVLGYAKTKEDAELIMTAVNLHAKLLDALKAAVMHIDCYSRYTDWPGVEQIRALLKEAQGGAK